MSWIGVDLDGTLAVHDKWRGASHVGAPIPLMVERVKQWLSEGQEVRIFTARMAGHNLPDILTGKLADVVTPIEEWCKEHIGQILAITNVKDFEMWQLWDDRAVQVIPNTGIAVLLP